jgi:hypothetical protein
MNQTLQSAADYLKAHDLSFSTPPGEDFLLLGMSGKELEWMDHLSTSGDGSILTLLIRLAAKVPPARRSACAQLIAKINHGQRLGAFHLDMNDGEVLFCISNLVPPGGEMGPVLEAMLGISYSQMEEGGPEILKLIFGAGGPQPRRPGSERLPGGPRLELN